MNEIDINDHDLIDRYLLNKLKETERTEFEIRLLDEPQLLRETQLRDAFVNELKQSSAVKSARIQESNTRNIAFGRFNFRQWILLPYSQAASVLILVSVVIFAQLPDYGSNESSENAITGYGSTAILQTLRSESSVIPVSGQPPIGLMVDTGPERSSTYTFTLREQGGDNTRLSRSQLTLAADGWLHVTIHRSLRGEYEAEVTDAEGKVLMTYGVRFTE